MARADGAQFRHTDLELAQHLQQESLELGVGAVDLVDQQQRRLVAGDGLQQGPRQQEAFGEKDLFLAGELVGGFRQAAGRGQHLAQLVAQQLV